MVYDYVYLPPDIEQQAMIEIAGFCTFDRGLDMYCAKNLVDIVRPFIREKLNKHLEEIDKDYEKKLIKVSYRLNRIKAFFDKIKNQTDKHNICIIKPEEEIKLNKLLRKVSPTQSLLMDAYVFCIDNTNLREIKIKYEAISSQQNRYYKIEDPFMKSIKDSKNV